MAHHQSNVRTAEKAAHHATADAHAAPTTSNSKSHDAIAHRAYEIYLKSGSQHGHCMANWLKAEADLDHESKA